MNRKLRTWTFRTPSPAREVFAMMEQMIGTPPYRFEVIKEDEARIIQFEHFTGIGRWKNKDKKRKHVTCTARRGEDGTHVTVSCSRDAASRSRAIQIVSLFEQGKEDLRTIYRERIIPLGPVTLVASWAGTPYRLYLFPPNDAMRGAEVFTATPLTAIEVDNGNFCKVRLSTGEEGYIEKDLIVPVPTADTTAAQLAIAESVSA